MTAILRVEGLSVSYGSVRALESVDLEVEAGEATAVVGLNGAGKTTLLRAISGLQRTSSGTVTYLDSDLASFAPFRLPALGIVHVPQGRGVLGTLTVEENLLLTADAAGTSVSAMRDVYDRFPILAQRRHKPAGVLSGGEQQMLAISRCLMCDAKLLLLDEPSIGLAPIVVRQLFEMVDEIVRLGVAVLVVEQNVRIALQHSQRGYLLDRGRTVLEASAADLLQDPRVADAFLGRAARPDRSETQPNREIL